MPRFFQEVGYVDDWPVIYDMQLLKNTRGVVAGTGASGILCLWLGGRRPVDQEYESTPLLIILNKRQSRARRGAMRRGGGRRAPGGVRPAFYLVI